MKIIHVFFGDADKHPIVQNYQNLETEIIDAPKAKDFGRTQRALRLVKDLRCRLKKVNNKEKNAILHCHDPVSLMIALFLHSRRDIIFDAHEVYSSYIKNKILRFIIFQVEWILVRIPKKTIFPSYERGKIFFEKKEKFFVIENKLNDKNIPPNTKKEKKEKSNEIRCIFVGTFTDIRACREIIQATNLVKNEGYEITLDLFGSKNAFIENLIQFFPDYITFHGHINQKDLFERYKKYDIGFALYKPINLNNLYCAPTKIFEHEYFGVKTVAYNSAYISRKIRYKEFGNCTPTNSFDPSDISEAIKIANDRTLEKVEQKSLLWSSQSNEILKLYK